MPYGLAHQEKGGPMPTEKLRPARPAKLGFRFTRDEEGLAVIYSVRGKAAGVFMLLWLTGWSVGCVFLLGNAIKEPKLFNILFAMPFWAGEIFGIVILLRSFFSREYFLLNAAGAAFTRRIVIPLTTRIVPVEEIKSFQKCTIRRDSESGHITLGVKMETLGRPLYFAAELTAPECDWLADQLNDCLSSLAGFVGDTEDDIQEPVVNEEKKDDSAKQENAEEKEGDPSNDGNIYILELSKTPCEPPSDSRWERIDEIDSITFLQRGRILWNMLFGFLFATLFCNGIISVFVLNLWGFLQDQPKGFEWWFLFFFLIPFEIIGLCIFLGLFYQIFEPFRRTRWKFGKQEIECRWTWFGLGPRWVYAARPLDRLEMPDEVKKSSRNEKSNDLVVMLNEGANRTLRFIDRENTELTAMKRLTEGEARWIADTVLRERPYWFE
jgi:hypothetical protein